jgi:hypothetical protein
MALASSTAFSSFSITDKSQILDISPVLAEALYMDLEFLGSINMDFGNAVYDTSYTWNEDKLNADTGTVSGSVTSTATTVNLAAGHGARFNVGDLFYVVGAAKTELGQITAIATDALTVTRGYNSTAQQTILDTAVIKRIPASQEGSDFGSDKSGAVTVRTNFTQIMFGGDIFISRNQLDRKMAAIPDELAHQLGNRAIELKKLMTQAFLYSEKSSSAGSNSVYRSMGGLRAWINAASGVTNSSATALSWANVNALGNKPLVDLGVYPNTMLVGTDLAETIATYDSTNRRLLEADTQAGYTVNQLRLAQGNLVNVVVDGRVNTGDCFLYDNKRLRALPFINAGMFVIAAVDFTDGKKRRTGCEWTLEVRNPEAAAYLSNKS